MEEAGLLRAREREALVAAEEFLVRVRSALQLETGKRSDRLVSDVQPVIARQMGFTDEPRLSDVDGLMRSLFEHARQVVYSSEAAHARYLNGADTSEVAARTAEEVLRAFAAVAATKERLAPSLLDAAEEVEVPADPSWTPEMREDFLSILRGGEPGRKALEGLDRAGLLARLLPEWSDIRCRPQRDPYHRFTVDVHLIEALAGMGRMLSGEEVPDPIAAEAVRHVLDPDGALLGALLHDIGKNGTGGHVQVGAKVAASALARMGIVEPTRSLAEFMVQNHLLLPDTATRRDISDDDLVLDVAAAIGTPERLAALYLLAIADAAATGPAAWTPWRQALVRELVAKVQRTFERGDMGEEVAGRLTERIDRLRDLLEYEPSDAVDRFVLRMPRGYFLSVEPAQAAAHFTTISPQLGTSEVRTTASAGLRPGTYELLVVASDRPGLLSFIAGALSLAGLSILTAQVFTTEDGAAVDLFEVEGAFEPEIGEERWREFRSTLRRAIEGRVSLDHRVEEKRSHYPSPKRKVPVTVTIDNEASDFFTVIEIGAADRIGLLYDITRALADLELDVHLAKIATYTDRVIDAFYVRDALGRKIDDAASTESIDAAIGARLAD